MSHQRSPKIVRTHLEEHPAVQAWLRLAPQPDLPRKLRRVRERRKSAIYRLQGINGSGTVIAKRSRCDPGRYEQFLYESILPQQPASHLRFYGAVEDPDPAYRWLFLEDAGSERYGEDAAEYPALGVTWLAQLHTATTSTECPPGIAACGPEFYLRQRLQPAAANIADSLPNPVLGDDDRRVLRRIAAALDCLVIRWEELTAFCRPLPRCLVHGDFVPKNIGLVRDSELARLLPFDWETAGYGVPAADVVLCGDLAAYGRAVQPAWPRLPFADLQHLARIGEVFRLLASLHWRGPNLLTHWANRDLATMTGYRTRLDRVLSELGWE